MWRGRALQQELSASSERLVQLVVTYRNTSDPRIYPRCPSKVAQVLQANVQKSESNLFVRVKLLGKEWCGAKMQVIQIELKK